MLADVDAVSRAVGNFDVLDFNRAIFSALDTCAKSSAAVFLDVVASGDVAAGDGDVAA